MGVGADQGGGEYALVLQGDTDFFGVFNHVAVGQDIAVLADQYSRSHILAGAGNIRAAEDFLQTRTDLLQFHFLCVNTDDRGCGTVNGVGIGYGGNWRHDWTGSDFGLAGEPITETRPQVQNYEGQCQAGHY